MPDERCPRCLFHQADRLEKPGIARNAACLGFRGASPPLNSLFFLASWRSLRLCDFCIFVYLRKSFRGMPSRGECAQRPGSAFGDARTVLEFFGRDHHLIGPDVACPAVDSHGETIGGDEPGMNPAGPLFPYQDGESRFLVRSPRLRIQRYSSRLLKARRKPRS